MIITGTQRSGTMSYAHLLGIGHEKIFNPCNKLLPGNESAKIGLNVHSIHRVPKNNFNESSWLAAPHIASMLQEFNHRVIRLVRHPMKVINSLMGIEFWTLEGHKLYRDYISRYVELEEITLGMVDRTPIYLHLSAQYYIQWHKLIPHNTPTVRIEDLINGPQTNQRKRATFSFDDLATEDQEQLTQLTALWGYQLKPLTMPEKGCALV